ncbi:MAG: valine--tRNA ligase [Promethearchaeota archaeon]|nr:MAG: valine--tRNA ligase [Candidatus Lokiarchaeota archaeon]
MEVNMAQETTYPKRYKFKESQEKWIKYWKDEGIYKFDINAKGEIFSIDTPPPFVSGTLHLGHILNHSWIDFVARYNKMKGRNVYFPQGYDCHGLPVELAVEKKYGISQHQRDEFLEKCIEWVEQNINNMTKQYDDLGYSTDWDFTYRTMKDDYKFKIQWSLLYFYEKGWLYREKFPTHFCVNCETSVAKAEVGYYEEPGKLWYLKLPIVGREDEYITIATTRPEYMEACVGVFIHPNDERYYHLSAAEVEIPMTDRTVRIEMDRNVDMNFGTGIVYCCTYGDELDIKWKINYDLDEIQIFTEDGHMNENSIYQGMTILEAREQILKDLDERSLVEKIEDYEHRVVIHSERSSCRKPIEYLPVYQWFINVKDFTDEIIESGNIMNWYPEKHKQRLIDWCEGVDWNWVISRQRVFGTPIPFWYCKECNEIIPPRVEDLPLDPVKTPPPVDKCPKCKSKNLLGEKDVCDCWIDSSITPLAIAKWLEDDDFFEKTYMKAKVHRPQGYEIIRTWLFYTLFRCKKLTGKAPFYETMINGMVAGPDSRKMSKSFGNIVSPDEVMPEFGADAIRQWAAMGSLGDDYPFEYTWIELQTKQPVSEDKIKEEMEKLPEDKFNKKYRRRFEQLIGASRFLTKIWNAYRFLGLNLNKFEISDINIDKNLLSVIDNYFYSEFNKNLELITKYFDEYNWHEAFTIVRPFFWNEICDNYIEAIKYKFYLEEQETREWALKNALNLFYKMLTIFAIIMPFISEEIYSNMYKKFKNLKSIHLERWPTPYENISEELAEKGKFGIDIIKILRNYKSKHQIPLNQEITRVIILSDKNKHEIINDLKEDIKNTIRIKNLEIYEKNQEDKIKDKPDSKEIIDELGIIFYFSL